jgi:hypothetical protein
MEPDTTKAGWTPVREAAALLAQFRRRPFVAAGRTLALVVIACCFVVPVMACHYLFSARLLLRWANWLWERVPGGESQTAAAHAADADVEPGLTVGSALGRARRRDLALGPEELFAELARYTSATEVASVRAAVDAGRFPLSSLDDLVHHRRAAFWAADGGRGAA